MNSQSNPVSDSRQPPQSPPLPPANQPFSSPPPPPRATPILIDRSDVNTSDTTQKPPRSISQLKPQADLGGKGQFISGIFLLIAIVSLIIAAIAGWVFYFWLKG
ncbi:MAG: hypothetical protein OXF30_02900 [Candidatus Saccharibacteria bacterium]|nr:hypothetical protein [Candidatus Saccharibacteria bacterium]